MSISFSFLCETDKFISCNNSLTLNTSMTETRSGWYAENRPPLSKVSSSLPSVPHMTVSCEHRRDASALRTQTMKELILYSIGSLLSLLALHRNINALYSNFHMEQAGNSEKLKLEIIAKSQSRSC